MAYNESLYKGITKAAWGYFFLYIHVNINGLDLLPSFVGYLLFLSAFSDLSQEERELSLLRPLTVLLVLWCTASWLLSIGEISLVEALPFMDIFVDLVNLYFHFQFLTNLASIVAGCGRDVGGMDQKLIKYRNVQTLMLTASIAVSYLRFYLYELALWSAAVFSIIYVIAGICMMILLFKVRRCLFDTEISA